MTCYVLINTHLHIYAKGPNKHTTKQHLPCLNVVIYKHKQRILSHNNNRLMTTAKQ